MPQERAEEEGGGVKLCILCNDRPAYKKRRTCVPCQKKRTADGLTKPQKPWTPPEEKRLAEIYPFFTIKEVAQKMGRTEESVRKRGQILGLKKDPLFRMTSEGREPWNKGISYMPKSAQEAIAKHGRIGGPSLPEGTRRLRNGVLWEKRSAQVWVRVKNEVWKQNNGPIPRGYNVCLIDGDPYNVSLENLVLRGSEINTKVRRQSAKKGWEKRKSGQGAAHTTGPSAPTQSQSAR